MGAERMSRMRNLILIFTLGVSSLSSAQNETTDPANVPVMDQSVKDKSIRLINTQTATMLPKGSFEVGIQHRFGAVNTGVDNLWGLDNFSSMRLSFDYGFHDRLTGGIGRSSLNKTYNAYLKASLLGGYNHKFNLVYLVDMAYDGRAQANWNLDPFYNTHRMYYTHQLIAAYMPLENVAVSVSPTLVHRNLVESSDLKNDIGLVVATLRLAVNKKMNLTGEFSQRVWGKSGISNSAMGIGFEYFTPKHAFQLSLSNTRSLNEAYFMTLDPPSKSLSQFNLGFNIVRRW